ncbi:sensor histidine kinase [Pseudonocardia acaciae]|uniref:sensor histidine kinase n=1 Tax=Pseudonocardia acaciae TaxID=551276 RepID=UPI000A0451A7|nr:ATP-binding protein [Pseudonocardia acaciae]
MLLTVRNPGSPVFDEAETQIVASFADQAALALRHAEAQTAVSEVEVPSDRDRIARDLRDQVIQRLFAVGLAMQSTHRRAKNPVVAQRLSEHIDQLHEVIQDIRTAIFDLQNATRDTAKLRTILHESITELTQDSPIRTTVRMAGDLDGLPAELADDVEAVIREAVSNTVRHSGATDMAVAITIQDNEVAAEVTDNGSGIPEATTLRSGLRNLEQRAASNGGTCAIERPDAGGTRLLWTAPATRGPARPV